MTVLDHLYCGLRPALYQINESMAARSTFHEDFNPTTCIIHMDGVGREYHVRSHLRDMTWHDQAWNDTTKANQHGRNATYVRD